MKFRDLRRKIIADYAVLPFIFCGMGLILAYGATRLVNHALRGLPEKWDMFIPVIPAWTVVYFLSYVFWILAYLRISKESKTMSNRLLVADIFGKIVCMAVFLIVPTTTVRPAVPDDMFLSPLLELLYFLDSPDNLFPSMHCSTSWFASRYLQRCETVSNKIKVLGWVSTGLVFLSVLFTKQHVIIDIIGGVVVAETCAIISDKSHLYKIYDKLDIVGRYYDRKVKEKQ